MGSLQWGEVNSSIPQQSVLEPVLFEIETI